MTQKFHENIETKTHFADIEHLVVGWVGERCVGVGCTPARLADCTKGWADKEKQRI